MADQTQQPQQQQPNDMESFMSHILKFFGLGGQPAAAPGMVKNPLTPQVLPKIQENNKTIEDMLKIDRGLGMATPPKPGPTNAQRSQ